MALNGFQNFLLGRVTSTQGASGIFNFYFRAPDYGLYLQDDWKYSSRLTLNLGIRWEGVTTAHDKRDFISNFRGLGDGSPGPIHIIHPAGTPKVGTPGVSSCTLLHCLSAKNFGPRVGFAYDVSGNQNTVIRGGYGIYYDRVSNQSLLQTTGGLPFQQTFAATPFSVTTQNPFPDVLPASAFPLSTDQVIPSLVGFDGTSGAPIFNSSDGTPAQGPFFFPVRNFRVPYTQEWNLTLQRSLGKGWIAEIGYVGAHAVALLGTGRPDNPGQICTVNRPCTIPASIGSGVTVPEGTPFVNKNSDGSLSITGNTPDNISARVPPLFLGLTDSGGFFQENQGFSWYNSLQATLSHQWSNGLYLQTAYTWSRLLDNGSGSTVSDESNGLQQFGDLLNPRSNYGLGDYDRTHRLVISYNYELPFAKIFHLANAGAVGRLVNGWAINGVTIFESGTPFNIIDSSSVLLEDTDLVNDTNFATLAPGVKYGQLITAGGTEQRLGSYIDLSKLVSGGNCVNNQNAVVGASSPDCTGFSAVGNIQRNTFRGPFQQNWDFSLVKSTKLTEHTSIDIRAEFFNVFNHPSFESPQAGPGGPFTGLFGGSFGNYGVIDVASGSSAILATVNRPRVIQFAAYVRF